MNIRTKVIIGVILGLAVISGGFIWYYKAAFMPQASVSSYPYPNTQPYTWPYTSPYTPPYTHPYTPPYTPPLTTTCQCPVFVSPYVINSSISASPSKAKADGQSVITVKVTVKDSKKNAVRGIPVYISYNNVRGSQVHPLKMVYSHYFTNYWGTATFRFTSLNPGTYVFGAMTDIQPKPVSYPYYCDPFIQIDRKAKAEFVK